jgi:aspartyl-tRNA(Asn)/glutamyl-tRNA(Gln) amidotransferase subunit B
VAVVSDDSALLAAVDQAIAANPDITDKVRSGKTAAARARELIVQRLTPG